MASKAEIEKLVDQVRALEWGVEETSSGRYRITTPGGTKIFTPSTGAGRSLANFKAELNRVGFNPEAAQEAKAERARMALAADREKNEAKIAAAEARAKQLVAPKPTNVFPALSVTMLRRTPLGGEAKVMASYDSEVVYVDATWAAEALERKQCRQRALSLRNVEKCKQAMLGGEWVLNPSDCLVFDEHGCLINGQHRMWALLQSDEQIMKRLYPDGVPFLVIYNYPARLAHVFDTGKARTASDALTVEGLKGWSSYQTAALRLVMSYDQSFAEDGIQMWTQWRKLVWTNSEQVSAAQGEYGKLLNYTSTASQLYNDARISRTAGLVAAYLIDRDNPGGSDQWANEEFWLGVRGKSQHYYENDPRLALMRYAVRSVGTRGKSDTSSNLLAHILRRYADFMLGISQQLSQAPDSKPMPPVWQPGMKWIVGELRYPKPHSGGPGGRTK